MTGCYAGSTIGTMRHTLVTYSLRCLFFLWGTFWMCLADDVEACVPAEDCVAMATYHDPCLYGNFTPDTPLEHFLVLKCKRNFDYRLPPYRRPGEAIRVNISVHINNMLDINEANMEYTVEMFLRQNWFDDRLQFANDISNVTSLVIPDVFYANVWLPDTFIRNGKEERTHSVTQDNRLFRVYRDGHITYSQRLTCTLWCRVNLTDFPMDNQTCYILIESYRYNSLELKLAWTQHDALQIGAYNLAMFELRHYTFSHEKSCTQKYNGFLEYDCLRVEFHFKRRIGYYMTQIYVPSILIVALSWVSFYLDPNSVPARVSLGILTILAMTNQLNSAASQALPRVSYIKAMDVWITACMTSLCLGVAEFAVVNTMARRPKNVIMAQARYRSQTYTAQNIMQLKSHMKSMGSSPKEDGGANNGTPLSEDVAVLERCPGRYITALHVDRVARVVFPIAFLIFNIAYWMHYLSDASDYIT